MKTQRTITIDQDLDTQLKENPQINVSGIVNKFLREYLEKNTE
jgi:post-segregation antitoxin (ccd killing protein)